MKITQLRQLIREEIESVMNESQMKLYTYDDDEVELSAYGDFYDGIEEDGKLTFSLSYEDKKKFRGKEFNNNNWNDILGPKHAFVKIAKRIPTEVETEGDIFKITVNFEDFEKISRII